jgi:hypothetical protein
MRTGSCALLVDLLRATEGGIVCLGWGTRADSYRNFTASPPIAIETGGVAYENPSLRVLAPEENHFIVVDYVRRFAGDCVPAGMRAGDRRPGSRRRTARTQPTALLVIQLKRTADLRA